jgi:DNA polymerase elongation subunit (family B)
MLSERIAPETDEAGSFLHVLNALTRLRLEHKSEARRPGVSSEERAYHDAMQQAMKVLINSFYGTMGADFALFCDKDAAARVTARGREILQMLLDELQARGAVLIEADTDGVLFSLPPRPDGRAWTYEDELAVIQSVGQAMPNGIQLEHDGRYRVMYSYLEKNYALLEYEREESAGVQPRDHMRLVGVAFKSSKAEALIERFVAEALRMLLEGEIGRIRDRFRELCGELRGKRVPVADLCVSMPLTKLPETYTQSRVTHKEEPYEVYLAAGQTMWKPGQRISYYQARGGKRLFQPGATDYDAEFYINRLKSTARQRLEKALKPEDLDVLLSEFEGLFDPPMSEIRTIRETHVAPLSAMEQAQPVEGEDDELQSVDEPLSAV